MNQWLALGLCLFSVSALAKAASTATTCFECHAEQYQAWQTSDHAKAMQVANDDTVLGNFNQQQVSHFQQQVRFFRQEQRFFAEVIEPSQAAEIFEIKYTFGHFPLQQYLVETQQGKLQVLPFSWDARAAAEGGQRWFHQYPEQDISPQDRLHWQQPMQNWNGMCADCHSDGLTRHYSPESNQFNTHFDQLNVGCQSCHQHTVTHWQEGSSSTTNHQWMETCYACHALRSPLTDGFQPTLGFYNQFSPQLLLPELYHADGQIKEEVYVFGSFMQSKMAQIGVNCSACHDAHSMKVKTKTNGLCLQCHAQSYDAATHHGHEPASTGAQCVNCHMPETTYMGVDPRRDHSFKIPRPDLTLAFGVPNACQDCHQQSVAWQAEQLRELHGQPRTLSRTETDYLTLQTMQTISLKRQLAIAADQQLDPMRRATAIYLLLYRSGAGSGASQAQNTVQASDLMPFAQSTEVLLRLATAKAAVLLMGEEKLKLLAPLLEDQLRAVRVAAVQSLTGVQIPDELLPSYQTALREFYQAQQQASWRAEANLNLGNMARGQGEFEQAVTHFKQAITVEPYFDLGYIHLADVYRLQSQAAQAQQTDQAKQEILAEQTLIAGIAANPNSAHLHYAYGLHLIRSQQKAKAIDYLAKAVELEPASLQYLYAYLLGLDDQGQTQRAASLLLQVKEQFGQSAQYQQLKRYFASKLQTQAPHPPSGAQ